METQKEIRYYLANKQSWSDVTTSVMTRKTPRKGDVINVGKIKMTVKDVQDGTLKGRPITRVTLESLNETYTIIDQLVEDYGELTVLEISEPVDEARKDAKALKNKSNPWDNRIQTSVDLTGPYNYNEPLKYMGPGTQASLGGYFRSGLQMGTGYGTVVTDFGEAVLVNITYSNAQTGRTAGQNFVVVYHRGAKYPYRVYNTSVRWRDCAGYDQAINYIRGKATALQGMASSSL